MPDPTSPGLFEGSASPGEARHGRGRLDPPGPTESLRPGTQLSGIYEIERLIASGGMGEVYKGHAIRTGNEVAIKVIRPDLADNELVLSLFVKEASALYTLHHEAIVRYFIFEVDPVLGRAYLAMDFVEGEPLSEILRRGPMPIATVASLAVRIAEGLHAAHRRGIAHRDISPDNIIICNGDVGAAMIIDFGIARSTRSGNETIVDVNFAGKYNYVSPEQLGLFGGEVTPRSDIYSLGLVLLAALRGAPVDMSGRHAEVIAKRQKVPSLDGIDAKARPILAKMLQPDPVNRPESMLEVARAFEVLTGKGKSDPKDKARRSPLLVAGVVATLVAVVGAGAGVYYLWPGQVTDVGGGDKRRDDTTPPPPPPPPPPVIQLTRVESITRYIEAYRGGSCVYVAPRKVTDTSAEIDGFALKAAPFDELDRTFAEAFGFEARIRAMIIDTAQCPVLSFLDSVKRDPRLAPRIELTSGLLATGRPLVGSVSWTGTRKVELLVVSIDGSVRNVTRFLRPGSDGAFEIPQEKAAIPHEPRLLLAISSAEPIAALADTKLPPSDTFFEKLLADPRLPKEPLGVALRYFQIE